MTDVQRGRIKIVEAQKRVRAYIGGELVADTVRPVLVWEKPSYPTYFLPSADVRASLEDTGTILFETGLPPRYYLPLTDVRMDLLRPSTTETHCPYKGTANYWSLEVKGTLHEDAVWIYRAPFPESQKIAGLAAFYNERVDLYVDGQLQERPRSPFS